MKLPRIEVRAPRGAAEFTQSVDVTYQVFAGFGAPIERARLWCEHIGAANVRVALLDGQVAGTLGMIEFGQWFGGRSVPSIGISMVGVRPEQRGAGVATAMMQACVREMAQRGAALSVLYPSTYALYRKAGYEPAGSRNFYQYALANIGPVARECAMRPVADADRPHMARVHAERARRTAGNIDRRPADWEWLLTGASDKIYAYVVESRGKKPQIDGYLIYTQAAKPRAPYDIYVRDMAAANLPAARTILAFLRDHGTMAEGVCFESGPAELITLAAREEYLTVKHRLPWMLRILNLEKAIAARGYSSLLTAGVELTIEDDVLRQNRGKFVLSVAQGRGSLRRGGKGGVRADIRGLAPLFSGYLSAEELQLRGQVDGPADELAKLSAIFAGPAPWMSDRF